MNRDGDLRGAVPRGAAGVPSGGVEVLRAMGAEDSGGPGGHEQVVFCRDGPTGLRAIIAIHSTALGPALGGTRWRPYPSEAEALGDVLRLSAAMTLKNAAAGLDLGGGKAVIIGAPERDRSEPLLRVYGRFIEGLGGRYITAEDVGTTTADMDTIATETRSVTGVSESLGGSGDPSPATAWGVLWAMRAALEHRTGSDSLEGRRVVVAGVGKVGGALVAHLVEAGARVTVADVDAGAVDRVRSRFGVEVADPRSAHTRPADVYAPCALGGVLNERTIDEIAAPVVCGAANNQLATPGDARRLADRGILYAPDFIVNAGGVINIAEELRGYDRSRAWDRIRGIGDRLRTVLERAEREGVTTHDAAVGWAVERIGAVSRLRRVMTPR